MAADTALAKILCRQKCFRLAAVESAPQFTVSVDNFVGKLSGWVGRGRQIWACNKLPKNQAPINRFKSITY
jgi:hypothetical protein